MFPRIAHRVQGFRSFASGRPILSLNVRRSFGNVCGQATASTRQRRSALTLSAFALAGTFTCTSLILLRDQIHSDGFEEIDSQAYQQERVPDFRALHDHARTLLAENITDFPVGDSMFYSSQVLSSQGYLRMCSGLAYFPDERQIPYMGIYDGINGEEISRWLQDNFGLAMTGAIVDMYQEEANVMNGFNTEESEGRSMPDPEPSAEAFQHTMKSTFLRVEQDLVAADLTAACRDPEQVLLGADAGASTMFAWYDPKTRLLHVAHAGNCQAVLARRSEDAKGNVCYKAEIVSRPHTIQNDRADFDATHPGEFEKYSTTSPLQLSRVLGLGRYKWSIGMQKELLKNRIGSPIADYIRTPPYATAEPEVSTLQVEKGDFLILGSHGFWECLTSDEAVGLVQLWLQNPKHSVREKNAEPTVDRSGFSKTYSPRSLPNAPLSALDNTVAYRQWNAEKKFVEVDSSAATHLLRNAFGGADQDLTRWLLNLDSPRSHPWRGDAGVGIAFF